MNSSFPASTLRQLEIKQKLPWSRNNVRVTLVRKDGPEFCQLLLNSFNYY